MVTGEAAKGKSKQQQRIKHVPKRTCIACGATKAKKDLIRVVRTPEGSVEVDITGKKSGRGAYLCRQEACWDIGLKKKRLDRALHTTISDEARRQLSEFAKTIPNSAKNDKVDDC